MVMLYPMLSTYSALLHRRASGRGMHLTRDREKAETALFEHIRKAVNSQETAPKQKHVRGKRAMGGGGGG